ncbi:mannose-6-phosphate isomerase, class I [Bacillus cereus BAG6X1-2]|nr:mannose-6-phosphate isomerase, class I [Bacillus cereus BAG6X1-2]
MQPLILEPIFQERIWGGTSLREKFLYDIPSETTGECWAIAAHPNGHSMIENGPFEGKSLNELWKEQPELFGNPKDSIFPLLTKILDANMDLSIQVHPDNTYAKTYEQGERGKNECWYIINCKEEAEIVMGHNAKNKEEFVYLIKQKNWNILLRRVKIKPGDFFYVSSGTIHALCEGTLVLETQQNSDTTYRLYDYDRKDVNGNKRELHLDKAIEVINVPHINLVSESSVEIRENTTITTFVNSEFFTVYKWDINGKYTFSCDKNYLFCSVIKGKGILAHKRNRYKLHKGTHFLLPVNLGEFELNGDCEIIVSHT